MLWHKLSLRRKKDFFCLTILMFMTSMLEVISIGAIFPFLAALSNPAEFTKIPSLQIALSIFRLDEQDKIIYYLAVFFGISVIIACAVRLITLWFSTKVAYKIGSDLSIQIFTRTLHQDYSVQCSRNSSELINSIINKVNVVVGSVIYAFITLIISTILLLFVMGGLLLISPVFTLIIFFCFGIAYFIIIILTRSRLHRDSQIIAKESSVTIKILQEALGGIRDILIDGSQEEFCKNFHRADLRLRTAQGNSLFINQSPRYLMEAFGMTLIALLAFFLSSGVDGLLIVVPLLGVLALGAQRLLPVLQQGYSAWAGICGSQASLHDCLKLLDQPLPEESKNFTTDPISFSKNIRLNDVSFRYGPETPWVLKNINLVIERGSRIGFVGTTGTGKSTLLDILMGLLHPSVGFLEIDGVAITSKNRRAWQSQISHVPQVIYLSDATIEENIAFGVPSQQINHEKVKSAAKQAGISQVIEGWNLGYKTLVGERGIRLSGGQRQRIGIARALYKDAKVIFFDEATNALDAETEMSVMDAINELDPELTVLIIAHRINTLKNCSKIIELGNGRIVRMETYDVILNSLT